MAQKPSIPKGTRDFNPEEVAKRNYIFNTIKSKFERFGFMPIETPSFENSDTLMGKYGEEGDRLIFKILNSGDYFSKVKDILTEVSILKETIFDVIEILKKRYINIYSGLDFENRELVNETVKSILTEGSLDNIFLQETYLETVNQRVNYSKHQNEFANSLYPAVGRLILEHTFYYAFFDSKLVFESVKYALDSIYLNYLESSKVTSVISEKALRYDLTVPFARYVVQHQNEIEFPFKRYQMQPVWRADRPQKGRFREFYQCDADVVGSNSLWQEVELVQLYDEVFTALKLEGATIKINNRKILSGIAEVIGASDKLIDFTVALDKLDKIGEEKVKEEMLSKGISPEGIEKLQPLFTLSGDFGTQVESLNSILSTSEEGKKGIEELQFINTAISELGLKSAILQLDVTLARGLNYYTGAIFEVSAPNVAMGSIGGGGRYDDLTGIFGMKNMSGVGISFGLDRIYLVLEELELFPKTITKSTEVLFINFGEKEALYSLKAIKTLREKGINAELYPDNAKMKKQMNYANKRNIPFVIIVGEQEIENNLFALKNMITGEQQNVNLEQVVKKFS
ncbi:histidine--tRNA ligase [Mesoflavibacter sp. SCSIO 43206]|uniref:histidine--tRNA ligase n=1 Tax=Mesoflavibacter sp. SCSIO 43206 TaxID=2779362 RepID=UPI001CA8AC5F|nr:histidine--tRNA ligase [Mesoflavibacter sp. SCSIO 43206]UAB75454.1 histidine--tRNA ligase [Mesoflavibacter sp. SCSIO 43206]